MTSLANSGLSYSVINSHKSAIGQTLATCGNNMFMNNAIFSRFMKGVFVSKPPKPKYTCTWDVSYVLRWLEKQFPLERLSLKDLTLKLTALLALSSAQRVQTLKLLKINLLSFFGDYVVFTIDELTKTARPGKTLQKVKLNKFTNENLCPIHTLKFYVQKTKDIRKCNQLLISYKTLKAVSTSTIARWLKEVLSLAGVDTSIFKAHSYRSASTSAAYSSGISLSDILSTANWTNADTFYKFYNRDCAVSYSASVLSKK